jgi:hypothetical protein
MLSTSSQPGSSAIVAHLQGGRARRGAGQGAAGRQAGSRRKRARDGFRRCNRPTQPVPGLAQEGQAQNATTAAEESSSGDLGAYSQGV